MANILFDKLVKSEFGKIRSFTKRTIKEYSNTDKEDTSEIIETVKSTIDDKGTIEMNKKIELLESYKYLDIYKVTCKKEKFEDFLFAEDEDDVKEQILKNKKEFSSNIQRFIKNATIQKMNYVDLKTNKKFLKSFSEVSTEQIQKLISLVDKKRKIFLSKRISFAKYFTLHGFNIYKVYNKTLSKTTYEFAKNENDAKLINLVYILTRYKNNESSIRLLHKKIDFFVEKLSNENFLLDLENPDFIVDSASLSIATQRCATVQKAENFISTILRLYEMKNDIFLLNSDEKKEVLEKMKLLRK